MDHSEFAIGRGFWCSDRRWRCTDIGRRVIVAIRVDETTVVSLDTETRIETSGTIDTEEAEREGWFDGPPYAVAECVFDEYDLEGCTLTAQEQ